MRHFHYLGLAFHAFRATALVGRQAPSGVPSYVTEYAPLVYLYTEEEYYPGDLQAQLDNTQPEVNFTVVAGAPNPLTLDVLNIVTSNTTDVYLTSKENVGNVPAWLRGVVPNSSGETVDAVSCAIIVNDHGGGSLVDVFYMYFYAFNYGGDYYGFIVDDHVGDWEHNMIRFENGIPQAMWFSQHDNGEAFTYECLEKIGVRPVDYSANGTHANYAINGTHDHVIPDVNLPFGPVNDYTNNGALWDPTLSAYYVSYDAASSTFTAYDDTTPVSWLYFLGGWGDQQYPLSNPLQSYALGIEALAKYTSGPTGPIDKDLNRTEVCLDNGYICILRQALGP